MNPPPSPTMHSRWRFLATRRFGVYLAVTLLWLAVMARMWVREAGRYGSSLKKMGISPEVLLVSWVDYEHWLWIQQNGRSTGAVMLGITPQLTHTPAAAGSRPESGGYLMRSRLFNQFHFGLLDLPVEISWLVRMNSAFELETLQGVLRVAGQAAGLQAFAENKSLYYRLSMSANGVSSATVPSAAALPLGSWLSQLAGRELCGRAPLPEPIFMVDAVIPVLTRSETLKAGERWVTRASDPLAGVTGQEVRITVERQEEISLGARENVLAWRLLEQIGAAQSTLWYDVYGRMIKADLSNGLHLVRASAAAIEQAFPALQHGLVFPDRLDRDAIRRHLDPKLDGKPLSQLLPPLPGL